MARFSLHPSDPVTGYGSCVPRSLLQDMAGVTYLLPNLLQPRVWATLPYIIQPCWLPILIIPLGLLATVPGSYLSHLPPSHITWTVPDVLALTMFPLYNKPSPLPYLSFYFFSFSRSGWRAGHRVALEQEDRGRHSWDGMSRVAPQPWNGVSIFEPCKTEPPLFFLL